VSHEGDPIQHAYDRWSEVYDSDANATRDLDASVLRRQPLALEGKDVLELGAGTGKNTVWLAERARQVVALDFSQGMLDRARARLGSAGNVRFQLQDLRAHWAVPDAAFDRVVGNLVLEHIAELVPIFAQAALALRPGGTLYLCELHPFRQRTGAQAQFSGGSGRERVTAFLHDVSDYVAAGLGAGLSLCALEEWWDDPADRSAAPRLLSQRWSRDA
jgi:ubiquinone/menaquinone biosynthesis C-methylase UbiE